MRLVKSVKSFLFALPVCYNQYSGASPLCQYCRYFHAVVAYCDAKKTTFWVVIFSIYVFGHRNQHLFQWVLKLSIATIGNDASPPRVARGKILVVHWNATTKHFAVADTLLFALQSALIWCENLCVWVRRRFLQQILLSSDAQVNWKFRIFYLKTRMNPNHKHEFLCCQSIYFWRRCVIHMNR